MSLAWQREDATVTVVHSRTKNPEEITREADIVITAVGQPNMVRGSWIKPGAVVIDVGFNHVEVCPVLGKDHLILILIHSLIHSSHI